MLGDWLCAAFIGFMVGAGADKHTPLTRALVGVLIFALCFAAFEVHRQYMPIFP